jgi:hypothetical protein
MRSTHLSAEESHQSQQKGYPFFWGFCVDSFLESVFFRLFSLDTDVESAKSLDVNTNAPSPSASNSGAVLFMEEEALVFTVRVVVSWEPGVAMVSSAGGAGSDGDVVTFTV